VDDYRNRRRVAREDAEEHRDARTCRGCGEIARVVELVNGRECAACVKARKAAEYRRRVKRRAA
jgi:hypothetical protein